MVESHLQDGAQKFSAGQDDPAQLAYGQSITDACIGWDDSVAVLQTLSDAVVLGAPPALSPSARQPQAAPRAPPWLGSEPLRVMVVASELITRLVKAIRRFAVSTATPVGGAATRASVATAAAPPPPPPPRDTAAKNKTTGQHGVTGWAAWPGMARLQPSAGRVLVPLS